MVYARLKFTLSDQPRTALLTDRGWVILHADSGMNSLLNHICPLPEGSEDGQPEPTEGIAGCAARAAELLGGTIER